MKLLEGKVALITGAARGIGKAIALKFASEGCDIAFTDLVIDENGNVEVTNKVADGIFSGAGAIGKTYSVLTADEKVLAAIENCVKTRESGSVEFEEDGKTYMVALNLLDNGYVVLVASDITAVRKGEKMRSEFFALANANETQRSSATLSGMSGRQKGKGASRWRR